jgi:hypothetical protein
MLTVYVGHCEHQTAHSLVDIGVATIPNRHTICVRAGGWYYGYNINERHLGIPLKCWWPAGRRDGAVQWCVQYIHE